MATLLMMVCRPRFQADTTILMSTTARLKVLDSLNTAKNSISSMLNVLDGSEDALLFRPGNQAIDEVVNGIEAASKIADAVKDGKTPIDAEYVLSFLLESPSNLPLAKFP